MLPAELMNLNEKKFKPHIILTGGLANIFKNDIYTISGKLRHLYENIKLKIDNKAILVNEAKPIHAEGT